MKKFKLFCSCMLFCSGSAMATLSGSDDFNDNSRDTGKWVIAEPNLTETNGRLELTTTGSGDEDGIWIWIANEGTQYESWTATIDAYNTSAPTLSNQLCAVGIFVVNSADDADVFGIMLVAQEYGRGIGGGWDVDGVDHFDGIYTGSSSANLRINYDAATAELSCLYNTGSGFTVLTNFPVSGWSMESTNTFRLAISEWTENSVAVSSGQVYADNFMASSVTDISNHLEFAALDLIRQFGDPTDSEDDIYEFQFDADTDSSVTNMFLITPDSEVIAITNNFTVYDYRTWIYIESSSNSLSDRFADGNYRIEVTYTNGSSESTIIPFAEDDGITPLADVTMQPLFSSPSPLQGAFFVNTLPITLEWDTIDAHANAFFIDAYLNDYDYRNLGLYSDFLWFADGPLSTRSLAPEYFDAGEWDIEFWVGNVTLGTNNAGVLYGVSKAVESDYYFTVLDASGDEDEDGQNNEQEHIAGTDPTNPSSYFMITNCTAVGSGFMIEWHPSMTGRVYRTLWTDNLTNGFQTLETDILYPRNSCTDTVHEVTVGGFYQVEVELQ